MVNTPDNSDGRGKGGGGKSAHKDGATPSSKATKVAAAGRGKRPAAANAASSVIGSGLKRVSQLLNNVQAMSLRGSAIDSATNEAISSALNESSSSSSRHPRSSLIGYISPATQLSNVGSDIGVGRALQHAPLMQIVSKLSGGGNGSQVGGGSIVEPQQQRRGGNVERAGNAPGAPATTNAAAAQLPPQSNSTAATRNAKVGGQMPAASGKAAADARKPPGAEQSAGSSPSPLLQPPPSSLQAPSPPEQQQQQQRQPATTAQGKATAANAIGAKQAATSALPTLQLQAPAATNGAKAAAAAAAAATTPQQSKQQSVVAHTHKAAKNSLAHSASKHARKDTGGSSELSAAQQNSDGNRRSSIGQRQFTQVARRASAAVINNSSQQPLSTTKSTFSNASSSFSTVSDRQKQKQSAAKTAALATATPQKTTTTPTTTTTNNKTKSSSVNKPPQFKGATKTTATNTSQQQQKTLAAAANQNQTQKSSPLTTTTVFTTTTKTIVTTSTSRNNRNNNNNKMSVDQSVIDKLEAGYAKLQAATPEQCHSLLKKYLTRDVLDKLKTLKTAMGATLLDVCQSGFENLDSGIGVYAPDAESYTLFADLFNPIIEDYHKGFKPTDKHPAPDFGDVDSLVNVDPNNKYVISTRVRCGRSIQGYPFNPCLVEAQYKEMEQKVSSVLKENTGDLAGTYYPLAGMSKETQQKLIDDHFLFKEGDRFLQAANANHYWPAGRGIFHNEAKSFLVWVNEEDHLRIISMQMGGNLKEVYSRMVRGAKTIEAKVPFSHDDRLGFLTFCPTNLGTTIRASVHIKLPKLAADRKKLEEVAGKFNLQVRGTSGEHTASVGGVYDISNKRRLGLTEYQAVREMQDGILELIKIEESL